MTVRQIYLYLRDKKDLELGAPKAIYRSSDNNGVFKSEEDFLDYLRRWNAPRYGDVDYLGIRDREGKLPDHKPLRVYMQNYTVEKVVQNEDVILSGIDMPPNVIAVVVDGPHKDDLVISLKNQIISINNPTHSWVEKESKDLKVRLLKPGEEFVIRGR